LDDILLTLERRGCTYVRKHAPFYVCSIGAHLFNLVNRDKGILYEAELIYDTRLHIMFVAPPGFSKTFWIRQFLDWRTGILSGTKVNTAMEGYMTEAGWVGSVTFRDGEVQFSQGAAQENKNAIIGCEEFSAIVAAMQKEYSKALDQALLTSLDSGLVIKRLRAGKIHYYTRATLWTATQPARFDLSSGMGRRLLFILFLPTSQDVALLKRTRRKSLGKYPTPIQHLKQKIDKLVDDMEKIQLVKFHSSIHEYLNTLNVPHYEEMLYERLCLGYNLVTKPIEETFVVTLDERLKQLINLEHYWRIAIKRGPQFAQVTRILSEAGEPLTPKQLRDRMLLFGYDWAKSSELIREMLKLGILKYKSGKLKLE